MRTHHDQLAKRALAEILADVAEVRLEAEVIASARRVDVSFVPRDSDSAVRRRLGLLGRIAATPGFIESFSRTPGIEAIYDCINKLLAARGHERRRRDDDSMPGRILWVLSPGRPDQALRILGMRRLRGWPAGVFATTAEFPLRIVVLDELPHRRHTLLLRLLGSERARRDVVLEARRLPDGSLERRLTASILLSWYRQIRRRVATTDKEQEIVTLLEELEAHEQKIRRAAIKVGREAGRAEGHAEALRSMFAKRLGRALTRAERRALDRRIEAFGPSAIEDIILSRSPTRLAAWLAATHPAE